MTGSLTPSGNGRLPVLFERARLDPTVLGNRTNERQKAFMELLGMAALHLVYVVDSSDGISAGGLFHWRKDTGPDRAYNLVATDYPRLPLFSWKGPAGRLPCRPDRGYPVRRRVRRYPRGRPC